MCIRLLGVVRKAHDIAAVDLSFPSESNRNRRISLVDGVRGSIKRYNAPSRNNGVDFHRHARAYERTTTDPSAVTDRDRRVPVAHRRVAKVVIT